MPKVIEGQFHTLPAGRIAIVAARFNDLVVQPLIAGACEALQRHGYPDDVIDLFRVPGSFEVPFLTAKLAASGTYLAVICLGCVIRGDTDHYDHVAGAATAGIADVARKADIPVIFGILTCENLEQALHRAGGKAGNKGYEAAVSALEMLSLIHQLSRS